MRSSLFLRPNEQTENGASDSKKQTNLIKRFFDSFICYHCSRDNIFPCGTPAHCQTKKYRSQSL